MDDEPQDIGPLVDRFAEDLAAGIPDPPWPPVYPKMPNEAPRVPTQPRPARPSERPPPPPPRGHANRFVAPVVQATESSNGET